MNGLGLNEGVDDEKPQCTYEGMGILKEVFGWVEVAPVTSAED